MDKATRDQAERLFDLLHDLAVCHVRAHHDRLTGRCLVDGSSCRWENTRIPSTPFESVVDDLLAEAERITEGAV